MPREVHVCLCLEGGLVVVGVRIGVGVVLRAWCGRAHSDEEETTAEGADDHYAVGELDGDGAEVVVGDSGCAGEGCV